MLGFNRIKINPNPILNYFNPFKNPSAGKQLLPNGMKS